MSTVIIYCHPYEGSFNHAVLEKVKENLKNQCQAFIVIDLYQDHFEPVYSKEELKLYHAGKTCDPLVSKYLAMIKQATSIIFITPIWWNTIPGMLKGFIDKVMKEGRAYHTLSLGLEFMVN